MSVHQGSERAGWMIPVVFAGFVVLVLAWFAIGMPGMDHSGGRMGPTDHAEMAPEALSPSAFAAERSVETAVVVNVHTPYEGEIAGTDLQIPFDGIRDTATLPRDTSTRILVYCRSGRMSVLAARALMADGYTNVAELDGGMLAWEAAGFDIIGAPPQSVR